MKRISFFVNPLKPAAGAVRDRLAAHAVRLGLAVTEDKPDAVVVLGGDGTMLSAVHRFPGVPLLGLNLGSLGYLAGVEAPRFEEALAALAEGRFTLSRRTALAVNGHVALNDVVVSKTVSGHAAVMALAVDARPATCFFADGLILATPTGSTAYSLAAGGPILLPDSQAFVVTPICPHALSSRPLVVPDTARFAVRLQEARAGATELEVCADGAPVARLREGDVVEIAKAATPVPLVQLEGYDPYGVLSRKLGWGGSSIA